MPRAALLTLLLTACPDNTMYELDEKTPAIRVTPTMVSFTLQSTAPEEVLVESVGDGPLTVSEVRIDDDEVFAWESADGALPGVLEAGDSSILTVIWAEIGTVTQATMHIFSDDPTLPDAEVWIDATFEGDTDADNDADSDTDSDADTDVGTPELLIDPDGWSFGELTVGDEAETSFLLTNVGDGVAHVSTVATTAAPFATDPAPWAAFDLAAGDDIEIPVVFAPSGAGAFAGSLVVGAEGLAELTASLSGTAVPASADTWQEYTWTSILQTYEVPDGISSVLIKAWGAGGGAGGYSGAASGDGGGGGYADATVAVSPGEILSVWPGQAGPTPSGGAGASYVTRADGTLLLVAGGGGGGGTDGGSM
ncbi:MAG: choice-of-anchor D domain-containing protein, partial [Pseudomonadota bacterium]